MRRNILEFIIGTILALAATTQAQLPIYEQWRREFSLNDSTNWPIWNIKMVAVDQPEPIGAQYYLISSQTLLTWRVGYGPSSYLSYDSRGFANLVDSSGVIWQNYLGNGSACGDNSYLYFINKLPQAVQMANGNLVTRAVLSEIREYDFGGNLVSSFGLPGPALLGSYNGPMISLHDGYVFTESSYIHFLDTQTRLLGSRRWEEIGFYGHYGTNANGENVFVLGVGVGSGNTYAAVLDNGFNPVQIDTLPIGYRALYAAKSSSGNIFTFGYGVGGANGGIMSIRKYSSSGEFLAMRDCPLSQPPLKVGPNFLITAHNLVCIQTIQGTQQVNYLNFFDEELDSLGRMQLDYSLLAMCSNDIGGFASVSSADNTLQNLILRNYSDANTNLPNFVSLPDNIEVSVYPNPFNNQTNFEFELPRASEASLRIYDITGRQVATVFDEFREAGTYTVNFDASALASGVYLYRFDAWQFTHSGKLLLIK